MFSNVLYNAVMNPFTCVRGLESGKDRFAENTPPSSSENAKVERKGSPEKSSFALSEDEVRYEPFSCVRGPRAGKVGS